MISLKTHNVMDYVIGAILVLCPYAFGFVDITTARNLFLILGFGLVGYSLLTNYDYSLLKILPLGLHMVLDVLAGITLVLAPAILGYRTTLTTTQYALHFVLGAGAIGLVVLTRTRTDIPSFAEKPDLRRPA